MMDSRDNLPGLLPCPFCGNDVSYQGAAIRCNSFRCNASLTPNWATKPIRVAKGNIDERLCLAKAETAQRWNRRAAPSPAPQDQQAETGTRKTFPILGSGGAAVDYQLVHDHGRQAQANHYQSVERLAQRGGLSWSELYAVLHDRKWEKVEENAAIAACRKVEAAYLAALAHPAPQAEAAPSRDDALREAASDLLTWFDGGPSPYGPWIIKAGPQGADDAVTALRAILEDRP